MNFNTWLDTFVSEKGLDLETSITVEGASGPNHMTAQTVVDHMKIAPTHEQNQLKNIIVRIDFANGDVMDFFRHLAQALAI